MKIIKESSAFLSNYEVLKLLKELQSDKKSSGSGKARTVPNLATVSYETITYLEQTACARQTDEHIEDFLQQISALPFKLTKIEKLQLINHRPTTAVEIQLLIEESEERLSEDDVQTILDLVERTLPPAVEEEAENEADDAEDDSMQCE
uniref:DNA-directed RNA polymerase III subunit RPC9 n=1 Tax=Amblyomma sculptum TaxID=1581419 RepID=A0A1E1XR46_AMBSC